MLVNTQIERFVCEIFTHDICRELYFLNRQKVLSCMNQDDVGWLKNLDYASCKKHSHSLRLKLMETVFKHYFSINLYYYDYMETLFSEFYLCHKLIPEEPFYDYCIRFGKFYQRNADQDPAMQPINQIMDYCLTRLIIKGSFFPDFLLNIPADWEKYNVIVPSYTITKQYDYDILDCLHRLKAKESLTEKKSAYLFTCLAQKMVVNKLSSIMMEWVQLTQQGLSMGDALKQCCGNTAETNYKNLSAHLYSLLKKKIFLLSC